MAGTQAVEVRTTAAFEDWLNDLRDRTAVTRIVTRIARVRSGLLGDIKSVGGGVSELRIDYGPGYRVYIAQRGPVIVILLCGGDKSTQARDIEKAKHMAADLED